MENMEKKNRGGRQPTPYPDNWKHVYDEWQSGEFSVAEACLILNLPKGTFYNMAKRYESQNGIVGVRHSNARKKVYKGQERVSPITGKYKDLSRKYSDYIERNILPCIDYRKLHDSYHSVNMEYAKGILNLLYQAMIKIYGNNIFTDLKNQSGNASESILIPGGAAGAKELCIALIVVDLKGTVTNVEFLTEFGSCLQNCGEDMPTEESHKLKEVVRRYTPLIVGYPVEFLKENLIINTLPERLKELLLNFRGSKVRLLCERNSN
ncbi:hypothetical protein [Lacrimispora sp.]|uniref:hypothetical protein n=1 Tax=Lacrimispora sp. TaxID=2719234 RepID=UPI003996C7BE